MIKLFIISSALIMVGHCGFISYAAPPVAKVAVNKIGGSFAYAAVHHYRAPVVYAAPKVVAPVHTVVAAPRVHLAPVHTVVSAPVHHPVYSAPKVHVAPVHTVVSAPIHHPVYTAPRIVKPVHTYFAAPRFLAAPLVYKYKAHHVL